MIQIDQKVNGLYTLSFEYEEDLKRFKQYYLPTIEIKNNLRTYDNIRKIPTDQGDNYTTGLLDYAYFKKYYKLIEIDLSNKQKLDDDPKAIQQIEFTLNIENNAAIFYIIEEIKETFLDFSKGIGKVLWFYFVLI